MKGILTPLSEIIGTLQTGDIVLCHGISPESIQIEAFEGSPWSHVGMVVKLPQFDFPLFWESNVLLNLKDVELGVAKTGPMLVPLKDRLYTDLANKDDVMFAVRRLQTERTEQMLAAVQAFIAEVHHATFPDTKEMEQEVKEGMEQGIATDYSSFFCSKLVAATYMQMGLLPSNPPANAYIPSEFSQDGSEIGKPVTFLNGATLGDEILLDVER